MIRIAAVGDIHFDRNSRGKLSQHFLNLEQRADLILIAGDLTQTGHVEEAKVLAEDLKHCPIPIFSVLGNHDYHSDQVDEIYTILKDAGVQILEQSSVVVEVGTRKVGIAGAKGFGGGYLGACGSDFGEHEMKSFIQTTKDCSESLRLSLENMKGVDYRIALLHYSPIAETLCGEKREIYPFLGSYLLGEAIDEAGCDIVFHGHAHRGIEKGVTPGGVPVRNVAQPVIRHAFNIYSLNKDGLVEHSHPIEQNLISL